MILGVNLAHLIDMEKSVLFSLLFVQNLIFVGKLCCAASRKKNLHQTSS